MKTTIKTHIGALMMVALLSVVGMLSSCGGSEPNPEPTAGDLVLASLATSPWKVKSVTVDGVDKSSMFADLTITFTSNQSLDGKPSAFSGSFTATNGGVVWPATGTWTITDPTVGSSLSRSDGVTIQLSEASATSIKMSLAWSKNTFGAGRVGSVKGQHVFTMGK